MRVQHRFSAYINAPQTHRLFTPFIIAAAAYAVLRAGVRFFGYALPGSCVTNTIINFNFWQSGACVPASMWLTNRISFFTSAHSWSWVLYGGFALLLTFYPRPFDGMRAFFMTGLLVAYHELTWFAAYGIMNHDPADLWGNFGAMIWLAGAILILGVIFRKREGFDIDSITKLFLVAGPLLGLNLWAFLFPGVYGAFIIALSDGVWFFLIVGFHHDLDLRLLAVLSVPFALFMAGWMAAGYPLSLDLKTGITPLLNDPLVAFVEFASWVFAAAVIGASYYVKQKAQ